MPSQYHSTRKSRFQPGMGDDIIRATVFVDFVPEDGARTLGRLSLQLRTHENPEECTRLHKKVVGSCLAYHVTSKDA